MVNRSSVDMFHRGNEGWRETINLLPTLFISLISFNRLLCTDYAVTEDEERGKSTKSRNSEAFIVAEFLILFFNDKYF